jgi:hypothetical protein
MGATPGIIDSDIEATANALAKRAKGDSNFDLSSDAERKALATLIAKAAQTLKSPRLMISLTKLHEQWEEYRRTYWAKHEALPEADTKDVDWDARERAALDDCLIEMRSKRLLFQGYPWTCDNCKHRNWVDFQALKGMLSCEVCNATKELPVNVAWHFRANEFLVDSLRLHSTLSVIWLLAALQAKARNSFLFLGPTAFGFDPDADTPDAEADLLAMVDGQAVLCEVKSTWTSVRASHISDLVALAKRIRPDSAVFAVMEEGGSRFATALQQAGRQLSESGIKLEIITPANYSVSDDPMLWG